MMLHFPKLRGSFALFLLMAATELTTVGGQFGEIASVITGLLGSAGTGAGLSGLSGLGSSAAGLAGAGATGAQGASAASGALSGAGQLYQLAQAALQLTGTGVGIANQASESAWFPVAVEHAAKMNRDFQERLLNRPGKASIVDVTESGRGNGGGLGSLGGGLSGLGGIEGLGGANGLPGLGGLGGFGGGNNKIGVEYGKEFESGESELETSTRYPHRPPAIVSPQGRLPLPGLASLLPGETPTHTATGDYHKRSGEGASTTAPTTQAIFGRGLPFTTPPPISVKTTTHFVDGPSLDYDGIDEQSTSVSKLAEWEKSTNKPSMEFNVDSESTSVAERNSDRDLAETTPHGTFGSVDASTADTDTTDNASKGSSPVPELNALIKSLRASNLSREAFAEIAKQLESSPAALARENPVGEEAASGISTLYKATHAGRHGTVVNEKRDNAANRNLQALNRALEADERVLRKVIGSTANAPYNNDLKNNRTEPVVITLRRPTSPTRGATRIRVHASRVLSGDDDDGREAPVASSHQWSVRSKITPNKEARATPDTLLDTSTAPNSAVSAKDNAFSRVHPRFIEGSRISTFNSNAGGSRKSDIGSPRVYSSTERRLSVSPTDSVDSRNPRESLQAVATPPPRQNPASTATGPVPNNWSNARDSNSQPYLHNPQQTNQGRYPFGYPYPHSHLPPHNSFHPQNTQQHQPQPHWPPLWPQQYQHQQQTQVGAQQAPRAYPARTLPNPSVTTPATIVHNPFGGHDTLLTLMQPHLRHYHHHQLFGSPTFNAAPAATLFPVSQFTYSRG